MASLKETKTRIASVKSTLKITSAMKMVSAAKLHRAQQAIGNMVPYQEKLHGILDHLLSSEKVRDAVSTQLVKEGAGNRVAIVAFSSNSSLCGGFNSTAVRSLINELDALKEEGIGQDMVDLYVVGRKMAEAARKMGITPKEDRSDIIDKPSYDEAAALGNALSDSFCNGDVSRVILLYNHYKSNSSQPPVRDTYLPLSLPKGEASDQDEDIIVEPDKVSVVESLLPKVLMLKVYTVLMDTCAAEHAARTVAMQLASDNADELLEELTLEYNKRRQQAITSELLDIVGGTMA